MVITEFGADAFDGDGPTGSENQTMQADCLQTLLGEADQNLAVRTSGGVSTGQVLFAWADEWWKADCDPTTAWTTHDGCASFQNFGYPDPNINEEWWGIATLNDADPNARSFRSAHDVVTTTWYLGDICTLDAVDFDPVSGDLALDFVPAAGSTDHTLYYGPLGSVSTYGYSGSVSGLGATGSSTVTLPSGSQFWVVVARDNDSEGCYGTDSSGAERPAYGGSGLPQSATTNCGCAAP
jgi:hypothetical protein